MINLEKSANIIYTKSTRISDLHRFLSIRARKVLSNLNINTLGELLTSNIYDIAKAQGCGIVCVREVKSTIRRFTYLKEETDSLKKINLCVDETPLSNKNSEHPLYLWQNDSLIINLQNLPESKLIRILGMLELERIQQTMKK